MKTFKLLFIVFLILPLLFSSAGFASQAASPAEKATAKVAKAKINAPTDDAGITASIKEKLAAAKSTKDSAIDVTVKDGVVTLTGKVEKGIQKGSATRMAKAVPGVKSVVNNVEVAHPTAPKKAKTKPTGN